MSFLAFNPESSPGASEPSSTRPAAEEETERGLDRTLLEKVLNETLAGSHADGGSAALSRGGLEALRDVARKHRGQPFVLEPVAVELVCAMLRLSQAQRSSASRELRMMSTHIARSMLDDPVARDRLKAFWGRLSEMER